MKPKMNIFDSMKLNFVKVLSGSFLLAALFSCKESGPELPVKDAEPLLSYVLPPVASPSSVIQLFGKNFSTMVDENIVTIGDQKATVLTAEASRLYVAVPQLAEGEYPVKLSVSGKQAGGEEITLGIKAAVVPAFNVFKLEPAKGFVGTQVRIVGEGFIAGETTVAFGGSPAELVSLTSNVIRAVAPVHSRGEVDLVVTRGQEQKILQFKYIEMTYTSNVPTSGSEGTEVVISGEGFGEDIEDVSVKIGDAECAVVSVTDSRLAVKIPKLLGGTYSFTVTVGERSVSGGSFTYLKSMYVQTVAGSGIQSFADGKGRQAGLTVVQSITLRPDGKCYVTQRGGDGKDGIRILDPSDWSVGTAVPASSPLFSNAHPWDACIDAAGNYFAALKGSTKILKIAADGEASIAAIADDNRSLNANPMSVKASSDGKYYILNRANPSYLTRVDSDFRFEQETSIPYSVEHLCWNADKSAFFFATNASPYGIYRYNLVDSSIEKLAGEGTLPTKDSYSESEEGKPLGATIGIVEGMALAEDGTLYFSDVTSYTIRKLVPDGNGDYSKGTVSLVAGMPFTRGKVDGAAAASSFTYPCGLAILADGSILVADGTGYVIRRIYSE